MGIVYLVGAGPGEPELLTIKGKQLLEKADVVLYDFLVAPELLKLAPDHAEKICVGKRKGYAEKSQDEINGLLAEYAKTHSVIVRLKGGTPFLFGKGFEEFTYLRKRGIACAVIPGVSAATAVPESFGIPLTISNTVSSVAYCSGHWAKTADIPVPVADIVVYFMALTNIPNIISRLLKSGRDPQSFCMVLSRGTLPDANQVTGTLQDIAHNPALISLKSPAMFLVGTVDFPQLLNAD